MTTSKKKQPVATGKIVVRNRKAHFEYEIVERHEAGMALKGSEVKSLRAGQMDIADAYVEVAGAELWLVGARITEYSHANRFNHDPLRRRKLLMNRAEITRIHVKVREKGLTLIPLTVYFNERGKAKLEIALVRGKRQYDKREDIRRRDDERQMARMRD
jgi:SsrA-binding protein